MAVGQDNISLLELFCVDEEVDAKYFFGTKADFISTGEFKPEWFPDVKGSNNNSMTIEGDELRSIGFDPLIEKLQIVCNEEDRERFDIQMNFTEEEQERRELIQVEKFNEQAYKEASILAKGWIDGMPTSVEGFKKHSERTKAGNANTPPQANKPACLRGTIQCVLSA